MSFTHLMEQKAFIKESCNIGNGENTPCSCYFWRFVSYFFLDKVKNF